MSLLTRLASYALVVGGLSLGLVHGVMWLVQPDASLRAQPRVAPVPPRIAESIERKQAFTPVVQPAALVTPAAAAPAAAAVEPAPAMKRVDAALTDQPVPRLKIHERSAPHKRKPKPIEMRSAYAAAREPAAAPAPVITTARSDVPY